ncbi:MAG: hypothetical protein H7Z41_16965 [Cytophagales bacterium]|nr:hypothetical protein [Armatimonadota bacterium]
MIWVIVGGILVIVAIFALWIRSRDKKYSKVFTDPHYVEFAGALPRMKAAALSRSEDGEDDDEEMPAPDDERVLQTSAGLAVFYTIHRRGDRYIHHYSVSLAGEYTASAVGIGFSLYFASLLGIPIEQLTLQLSEAGVFHTEFTRSGGEQAAFADRRIETLTPEAASLRFTRCLRQRESVTVTPMDVTAAETQ